MSHKQVIEKTRKALAGQTRGELLMRRTLLEAVIKTMQEKGDDQTWREVRTDDKLGVVEQYDLINEALHNLESPPTQTIGLERGIGHAKGLGPKGDCTVYQSFIVNVLSGHIDCTTGPFWISLHTGYSIAQTDETYADVDGAFEYTTAGGYTAGGKVAATPTVTKAAAVKFDADNPATWTSLLLDPTAPSHAILRYKIAGDTTDPLVCVWVLGTTNTNGGDYSLAFNGAGILTITA